MSMSYLHRTISNRISAMLGIPVHWLIAPSGKRRHRNLIHSFEYLEERIVLTSDWGDAPAPYATSIEENGAQHVSIGPMLGSIRDSESDGVHSLGADGDDLSGNVTDEDGVVWGELKIGSLQATAEFSVSNATPGTNLFAWIDFNCDGSWSGPSEQILSGLDVTDGKVDVTFPTPSWAKAGRTYARVRITTDEQLGPNGLASNGEVEDYQVNLLPPSTATAQFFNSNEISTFADMPYAIATADLDLDGDWDVISASTGDNMIAWYENVGHSQFSAHMISNAVGNPQTVFAIDLDADGDCDILTASYESGEVGWFENQNAGTFVYHVISNSVAFPLSVSAADIDHDGDMDVLSASRDNRVLLFRNNGNDVFELSTISDSSYGAAAVTTADINGDGLLDIVAASSFDNSVTWFENNRDGEFLARTISMEAVGVFAIAVADLDNDGDQDVVSTSIDDSTLAWYENDGSAVFTRHVISDSILGAFAMSVADLDGDGDLDLLCASAFDNTLAWYENNGDRTFVRNQISATLSEAGAVIATDLDLDGDLDVIGASTGDDRIVWFENQNPVNLTVSSVMASETSQTIVTLTATTATAVSEDKSVEVMLAGAGITDADYILSAHRITIPRGHTSGSVTLKFIDDATVEGTETMSIDIGHLSPGLDPGSIIHHSILITDNDQNVLTIGSETTREGERGEITIRVAVTSPVAVAGGFSVSFDVIDLSTSSDDYSIIANSPLIFSGQAGEVQTIDARIHGDTRIEPDESFRIRLGDVSATSAIVGQLVVSGANAVQTIQNDDFADVSISPLRDASEADPSILGEFLLQLSREVSVDTIANFSVSGSAIMASNGDFSPIVLNAVIPAGQKSVVVPVSVLNDLLVEGTETVTLTVNSLTENLVTQLAPDSSLRTATISIFDNDGPVVTSNPYVEVPENIARETAAHTFHAFVTDPDVEIRYSLGGIDSSHFHIDSKTGRIGFNESPDFESPLTNDGSSTYRIVVTATALVSPEISTSQELQIAVMPVNEFPPVIEVPSSVAIMENAPTDTVLLSIRASDADLPAETLTYSLFGPDAALFQLSTTGELRLLVSPDFEHPVDADQDNRYQVTIKVSDNGQPSRSSTHDVTVGVIPTNDSSPRFDTTNPTFTIPENLPAGTLVAVVAAVDSDLPTQALSYSITDGNLNQTFAIDPASGAITVFNSAGLDFESVSMFNLQVTASDNGSPNRSTNLRVAISLADVLDTPELKLGDAVTWTKLQSPVVILPDIEVAPSGELGGGKLTIRVNEVRTKRTALDSFQLPSLLALGQSGGPVSREGMLQLEVILNPTVTAEEIQAALRQLKFGTKGKGLKTQTRVMTIQLVDAAGHASDVRQTIRLQKGRK